MLPQKVRKQVARAILWLIAKVGIKCFICHKCMMWLIDLRICIAIYYAVVVFAVSGCMSSEYNVYTFHLN